MATNRDFTLRRHNGTDTDVLYPTTRWSQIEEKPSTFAPTAHSHDGLTSSGSISISSYGDVTIDPYSGIINAGTSRITNVVNPTSAQDAATKNYVDGKKNYRSISNFTSVSFNGANGITLPLDEDPTGKLIGLVFRYAYMSQSQYVVVWIKCISSSYAQTTLMAADPGTTASTTYTSTIYFNMTYSGTNIYISHIYRQLNYNAAASAHNISALSSYYSFIDIITMD